jgi:hypothetical protein
MPTTNDQQTSCGVYPASDCSAPNVPEPMMMILLGIGALLMAIRRRVKR